MNLDQVTQFVNQNKFLITPANLQSRCVDGRSPENENPDRIPAIAKPGGDVGEVITTFGALNKLGQKLPEQEVLDSVVEAVGGLANFKFHTDIHAEEKNAGTGLGCGHIRETVLDPYDYELTPEQTAFIKGILPDLLEKGAKQVVLTGDHEEEAVLVIDSKYFGVRPNGLLGNERVQVFSYQAPLHAEQLDKLSEILSKKLRATGQEVDEVLLRKTLDEVFKIQLDETLDRLAKDKPRFVVQIDEPGNVKVQAMAA